MLEFLSHSIELGETVSIYPAPLLLISTNLIVCTLDDNKFLSCESPKASYFIVTNVPAVNVFPCLRVK